MVDGMVLDKEEEVTAKHLIEAAKLGNAKAQAILDRGRSKVKYNSCWHTLARILERGVTSIHLYFSCCFQKETRKEKFSKETRKKKHGEIEVTSAFSTFNFFFIVLSW